MKVDKLVPEVYYKESRDFSYIGRLFELIFNYMKTGADLVEINPLNENITSNMLDLLATTLGFESKHSYNIKDLIYILSAFSELLKNKGSIKCIQTAIKTLLNSQKIDSKIDIVVGESKDETDKYTINIYLPESVTDLILLDDLFNYILPAGWLYNFILVEYNEKETSTRISQRNVGTIKGNLYNRNLSRIINNINGSSIPSKPLNLKDINDTNANLVEISTVYNHTIDNKETD